MKATKETLLEEFEITWRNRTPVEAVELLTSFGFTIIKETRGKNAIYRHNITEDTIDIGIGGNNLAGGTHRQVVNACKAVQALENTPEITDYTKPVAFKDAPELHLTMRIGKSMQPQQIDQIRNSAISQLRDFYKTTYSPLLKGLQENYGVTISRDISRNIVTFHCEACGIEKSIDYSTLAPEELIQHIHDLQSQIEEVLLERTSKFQEFLELGGKVTRGTADEPKELELPATAGSRKFRVATFGSANFLTHRSDRDICAAITDIINPKDSPNLEGKAEKISTDARIGKMHILNGFILATGEHNKETIFANSKRNFGLDPEHAPAFLDPEHKLIPPFYRSAQLRGLSDRIVEFVHQGMKEQGYEKEDIKRTCEKVEKGFRIISKEIERPAGEAVVTPQAR